MPGASSLIQRDGQQPAISRHSRRGTACPRPATRSIRYVNLRDRDADPRSSSGGNPESAPIPRRSCISLRREKMLTFRGQCRPITTNYGRNRFARRSHGSRSCRAAGATVPQVFADCLAPRTIVVVPGLSVDHEAARADRWSAPHYEERRLTILMLLRCRHPHSSVACRVKAGAQRCDRLRLLPAGERRGMS